MKQRFPTGFTLMEMIVAMMIMSMVFVGILPMLLSIRHRMQENYEKGIAVLAISNFKERKKAGAIGEEWRENTNVMLPMARIEVNGGKKRVCEAMTGGWCVTE